jgi:class 3 adenylate cyclase
MVAMRAGDGAAVVLDAPLPRRLLLGADTVLVGYCTLSVVVALVARGRGDAEVWPAVWIAALLVTNAAISFHPARRRHPMQAELVRAATGAVLAPAAYLSSERPFGHWWPGFVLLSLVGTLGVGLLATDARPGRAFAVYYLALFAGSAFLADGVTFSKAWVVGGGIAITSVVGAELIGGLGKQLAVEQAQRAQIEGLMHRVFPPVVADALSREGRVADQFADASILFADIVGFSPAASRLAPAEVVALLDEVFSALDALVDELGLEKIKTIGDCYMVAAGVPEPRPDHAEALCELALRIGELVASRRFAGEAIRFRIGINSGPIVAGVVGQKRFLYDLWGDAVNLASRMESHGEPGAVQITDATHRHVAGRFRCEDRGVIDIKGRGPMHVWHVVGRRDPAVVDVTDRSSTGAPAPTAPTSF